MTSNESPLKNLPPSAQLAFVHAQAAIPAPALIEEEAFVPSADDPVVLDHYSYEPLIAGDFPTPIAKPVTVPVMKKEVKKNPDLSSESAFPSLSSSASPRAPISSNWTSAASRLKSTQTTTRTRPMAPASGGKKVSTANSITDVLELPANQQISNMPNKPLGFKSSADVIQQVINKTGTNIIASTNRSGTTTFLIQGSTSDVAKAKRELVAGLVVKRTFEMTVPASTRRFIIGAKGKTLQQIEDKSNTRINFLRKEDEESTPADENSDEAVSVTIMGDATGIKIAKEEIDKIVGEKTAKQTLKIDNFDAKYNLFLAGPNNSTLNQLEEEYNVKIHIPAIVIEGNTNNDNVITIFGDKEKIAAAKSVLENTYANIEKESRTIAISIPKRQHKYLYGKNGESLKEIFNESGCIVELPSGEDSSENITVRGPEAKLVNGLTVVMEKARAVHVSVLDLSEMYKPSGGSALKQARYALQYLLKKGSLKKIENEHNVQIDVPEGKELKKNVNIEFVSKVEKDVALAQLAVTNLCRQLTPETFATIEVPIYLHHHLQTRHRAALDRLQNSQNVNIIIPKETDNTPIILLVYEGEDKSAAKASLDAALAEIKQIIDGSSDYVSKVISVPAKLHEIIAGPKNTTLNAILGTDTEAIVRFGTNNKDSIEIRGPSKVVGDAIAKIKAVQASAENEDFSKPYSTEFFIPANFSAHIIGKAGIHINKLKDDFGIKIDIGDNNKGEEKVQAKNNKKGGSSPVRVYITGNKLSVEAAKERILSQVSSLADQVTISMKVPREFHRFLIGPNGRYVKKLEEKYNVYIRFPKSNRGDESPGSNNPDEITVRGSKKECNSAKEELNELYVYEKEEQEKRKEREAKHRQYEEKRAAEDKRRAEEKAAKNAKETTE
ncbi:hypothetical protein BDB01DRAFT_851226 [Pilobolus umbonatus]|nr:hypothetical protein BDB01DRAFT_851226 [Pilobolus umbonatus]